MVHFIYIFNTGHELHYHIGVNVVIPGEGEKVVRAELLCAVVDLPAKAVLMNCNQYNGHCGCAVCKAPGEMVSESVCIPEC